MGEKTKSMVFYAKITFQCTGAKTNPKVVTFTFVVLDNQAVVGSVYPCIYFIFQKKGKSNLMRNNLWD